MWAGAGLLLCLLLAQRWVLRPALKNGRLLDDQLAVRESRLFRDLSLLARRAEIERDFQRLPASAKKGGPASPTSLLQEIESYARSAGVRIQDIRPASQGRRGSSVTAVFECPWPVLARFISGLEADAGLVIERASLTARDGGDIRGQILVVRAGSS